MKNYGVSVKKSLAFPLLVLSLKSPNGTYDSSFLSNYTTININDAIARIPGVGQINLFGGSDYAMRVWLRPDVIGRLGITIPDIVNAINQQNQLSPAGQIGGPPAAGRHRIHLYRPHPGPPAERGGVRQHHRADDRHRRRSPVERCRPPRARHDAVQRDRPAQPAARRRHRRLSDSGHQRARRREPRQADDG